MDGLTLPAAATLIIMAAVFDGLPGPSARNDECPRARLLLLFFLPLL